MGPSFWGFKCIIKISIWGPFPFTFYFRKESEDKSDVYNFGLILLEVLMGKMPSMGLHGPKELVTNTMHIMLTYTNYSLFCPKTIHQFTSIVFFLFVCAMEV